MASTYTSGTSSVVLERRVVPQRIHKYHWPAVQLNVWMLIMLAAASTILGVFATFITQQAVLGLGVPWYMPYFITVAALTILYIAMLLWLISQRRLLPSIVIIGAFMFFVLWMVGLIVTSIELWSPNGSVSANCNRLVFGQDPGSSNQERLAWLQQRSICTF